MKLRKADCLIMLSLWAVCTLLTERLLIAIASLAMAIVWFVTYNRLKE